MASNLLVNTSLVRQFKLTVRYINLAELVDKKGMGGEGNPRAVIVEDG